MRYVTEQMAWVLAAGLLAVGLSGCADKNSAGPTGVVDTTHTHRSFLPVLNGSSLDHSGFSRLSVVDSLQPSRVAEIASLDNGIQVFGHDHGHFHTGNYDKSKFLINEFHTTTLMYSRSDGLFRLDLAGAAVPEPVKVSSETRAASICHETMVRGNDFVKQDNSRLVYKVDNGAGCEAGVWRLIRLGMGPNDAPLSPPVTIARVIDGIYHPDTAALIGWIVVENQMLRRYDADFSAAQNARLPNGASIVVGGADVVDVWTRLPDRKSVLVQVGNQLVTYNAETDQAAVLFNALSDKGVIHREFQTKYIDRFSDGDAVYFFATVGDTSKLYRVQMDGVMTVLAAEVESDSSKIGWMYLTKQHVAYILIEPPLAPADANTPYLSYKIKMVHKTSGVAAFEAVPRDTSSVPVSLRGLQSKLYVFAVEKAGSANFTMRVIDDSSPASGGHISSARFVGETLSNQFDPTKSGWETKSMILQKDRRIISYDPVLEQERFDMGLLPVNQTGSVSFAWSRGHPFGLMTVSIATGENAEGAVYYFNTDKANSLERVSVNGSSVRHKPGESPAKSAASSNWQVE